MIMNIHLLLYTKSDFLLEINLKETDCMKLCYYGTQFSEFGMGKCNQIALVVFCNTCPHVTLETG